MNLFYNPKIEEFNKLISQLISNPEYNHLTVDNDGEVLLLSDSEKLMEKLHKFKFYVLDLRRQKCILAGAFRKDARYLRYFYRRLLDSWENGMRGNINKLVNEFN